jgi:hypothetical protein
MLHFGRGEKARMNPHPYQNAFDTAINELTEIAATFERLRARKGQIEGLILALQPFFENSPQVQPQVSAAVAEPAVAALPELKASDAEPPEGYSFRDVPNPLPDASEPEADPFQRRMKATFRFRGLAAQR